MLSYSLTLSLCLSLCLSVSHSVTHTRSRSRTHCVWAGIKFAAPGKERQDSVFNGLQTIPDNAALVCVHDAARPLVSQEEVYKVSDAERYRGCTSEGAARALTCGGFWARMQLTQRPFSHSALAPPTAFTANPKRDMHVRNWELTPLGNGATLILNLDHHTYTTGDQRRRRARRGGAGSAYEGHGQGERRRPVCAPDH